MEAPLDQQLQPTAETNDLIYHPLIFSLPKDEAALRSLLKKRPGIRICDCLPAQLRELLKSLNPREKFTDASLQDAVDKHLDNSNLTHYGCWVFYPWSNQLVHLLGAEEFGIVRTDRNRNKITREEQAKLAQQKVGVIGLSVGQSVSVTMALERAFGEIRLADFDTLDLSNLNRIRTGVHHLGMNKAVVTAREIAEIDPYLKVTCFTDGLTPANIDAFFMEGGPLDILVEECDSVDIKIMARQKAKKLGIPVVMDMSDRGCLDVERFDLEPERPIMHGWIDHLDLEAAKRPMTAEEKVPYMLPITGMETLSPRMKASVIELGQTISTWPQLATSVVLGGALAGDAVRRIALDQFRSSGRWFVDMEEQVGDPPVAEEAPSPRPAPFNLGAAELEQLEKELGPAPEDAVELDQRSLEQIVEAGGLAPSAGNMQPWKFLWHEKRLFLFHDKARSASFWDPDHLIAHIALGTCVENIVLKAHALQLEVRNQSALQIPGSSLIAVFEFHKHHVPGDEAHVVDDLAAMIGIRCTNRKLDQPAPIPSTLFPSLARVVESVLGCSVHLRDQPDDLAELARLCGAAERVRAMNPIGHREFFKHELRWTPEEAMATMDGLDLATMELNPMGIAGMQVASDLKAIELVNAWGGGKGMEDISGRAVRSASAVLLVSAASDSLADRLAGGRAVERLWMKANAEGFAVHPISAAIFLTHALRYEMKGLKPLERAELERIEERFNTSWNIGNQRPLFMIRLTRAGQPSVRSVRLDKDQLMIPSPIPSVAKP